MTESEVDKILTGNSEIEWKIRFAYSTISDRTSNLFARSKAACFYIYRSLESNCNIKLKEIEELLEELKKDLDLSCKRWYLSLRTAWIYYHIKHNNDVRGFCLETCDWNCLQQSPSSAINIARCLILYCMAESKKENIDLALKKAERVIRVGFLEIEILGAPLCRAKELTVLADAASLIVRISLQQESKQEERLIDIEPSFKGDQFFDCFQILKNKRIW